jgi:hypothetical protein
VTGDFYQGVPDDPDDIPSDLDRDPGEVRVELLDNGWVGFRMIRVDVDGCDERAVAMTLDAAQAIARDILTWEVPDDE